MQFQGKIQNELKDRRKALPEKNKKAAEAPPLFLFLSALGAQEEQKARGRTWLLP